MEAGGNSGGDNIVAGENYGGGSGAAFIGQIRLYKEEKYDYQIGAGRKDRISIVDKPKTTRWWRIKLWQ